MRFTDNPLEELMQQKPYAGRDDDPVNPRSTPSCYRCPHRSAVCDYGICFHVPTKRPDNAPDDAPVGNETE